jgi:hypothetical protein
MAAPEVASASITLSKNKSFQASFKDRANDPYGGGYTAVICFFNEESPVQGEQALFDLVVASSLNMGLLLGIFKDPNYEEGRSLALRGIKTFGDILGRPTEWDSRSFAFADDVVGEAAQSVEVLPNMFNRKWNDISTRIHGTIANVNQAWSSHLI